MSAARRTPISSALALAAALALVACGGRNDTNSLTNCFEQGLCECRDKSDCPAGKDCIDGRCGIIQEDAGPALLGFGLPCAADAQCQSGHCLPPGPGNGGVCTVECVPDTACPQQWDCKAAPAGDGGAGLRLCVPPIDRLCQACQQDADCNAIGDLCFIVGTQQVCGRDCSATDCPAGYLCTIVPGGDGGTRGRQCTPAAQTCECSAVSVGLTRACNNANQFGTCYGAQVCQASLTWSTCDAQVAAAEVCDGIDNNCNGLTDGDDPAIDTSSLPASPAYPSCRKGTGGSTCVGTWACVANAAGVFGWSCDAADPAEEVCNGRDDDCDGVADEPFVDAAGRYVDVHNCAECGFDCASAIDDLKKDATGQVVDGAVACEVRGQSPTCVPKQCAPGFYPYPETLPIMCMQAVSSECRACSNDGDCFVFSDRCVPVGGDPGSFCAQGCDADAPYAGCTGALGQQGCCPERHVCQSVGGHKLCMPLDGTCTCNAARVGATRPCFKSSATQTCLGIETCLEGGGGYNWDACNTSVTAKELCDYKDNDCDGFVDETFINQHGSGTYDVDEHCGTCETNCLAQWSKTIQHAIGGCRTAPTPVHCEIVGCTTESVAGGGACQRDVDCGAGRACHPLYRQCVRTCTGAASCGGNPCVDGFCTLACTSDAQCQAALGSPSTCQAGSCKVTYQFANVDKDPTNGCECPAAVGATDEPDTYPVYPQAGWAYVDRDCDGVDGVAARSLFVWAGSTTSQGTRDQPYKTIAEALAAFNPAQHAAILVAAGSYAENVALTNRVKLYGGYAPGFAKRDVVTNPTIIEGREPDFTSGGVKPGTVNATGITQPTVLAGFIVRGYDVTFRPPAGGAGKSSYAIYIKDSTSALVVANNRVVGGRGGDGSSGAPGAAGGNGGNGGNGLDTAECVTASGAYSTSCQGLSQAGGAGGANPACSAGGRPGASAKGGQDPQDYQSGGLDGLGGSNGSYAHALGAPEQGPLCKYDCTVPDPQVGILPGGDAQNGSAGSTGMGGGGCTGGVGGLAGGEWQGGSGAGGGGGQVGGGGGGGGAGGGADNQNAGTGCTVGHLAGDLGGTGGGGGAGGCGGGTGGGGGAGGGSFAIFVVFSANPASRPVIKGNQIDPGMGGFGGNGGAGGHGGLGGQGGKGGVSKLPAWCSGGGGHGGRGGDGGSGGGGGGGCGGTAYGLAGNLIAGANYDTQNSYGPVPQGAGGAAGAGGASPGGGTHNGSTGTPGDAAVYHAF